MYETAVYRQHRAATLFDHSVGVHTLLASDGVIRVCLPTKTCHSVGKTKDRLDIILHEYHALDNLYIIYIYQVYSVEWFALVCRQKHANLAGDVLTVNIVWVLFVREIHTLDNRH